jgi:hypothetical protein
VGAGAVAFTGGLEDGRVLVATTAFGFLTTFFFGFSALLDAARPFGRACLVALREPADFAFRPLVRLAMAADPSEAAQRIKDGVESRWEAPRHRGRLGCAQTHARP